MLDPLFLLSQRFLGFKALEFKRYFYKKNLLNESCSVILGARGIGKTTLLLQYVKDQIFLSNQPRSALYLPVDHSEFKNMSLYHIAQQFSLEGGKLLCIDEIHRYPEWARDLKSIRDSFPKLSLIVSGSSALKLSQAGADLSRRAIIYQMAGMSLREYIALEHGVTLEAYSLEDILSNHVEIAQSITKQLDNGLKILPLFKDFVRWGYYPFYREFQNKTLFWTALDQNIQTTIDTDLFAIYPKLTGTSAQKIKKLLGFVSKSTPFKMEYSNLKKAIDVTDLRTLKTYLFHLHDAQIISVIEKADKQLDALSHPEKLYLNNPNLLFALSPVQEPLAGTLRETFFVSQIMPLLDIKIATKGDFFIHQKYHVEVGGRGKTYQQIKNIKHSFIAADDIEVGTGHKIPLWLFGFLY